MKRPPMFLRLRVHGEKTRPRCWLPLFLLLPLILLILIILSPLILVVIIFLRLSGQGRRQLRVVRVAFGMLCSISGIRAAFDLLCSTRGFCVDVSGRNERVHISVI